MKTFLIITFIFAWISNIVGLENQLHYVIDDVPGGSYKYYSLMYDGLIKIHLNTQSGDADLYVSQTTTKPTYEPDRYCLQSTTCGEDIVYIPQSFQRPVSIGVYGHPSHETSHYKLLVYQVIDPDGNIFYDENIDNGKVRESHNPKMLEYENQMFLEVLQEDGLVITAKGLGLETVFMNILKAYSDPGQLVLVLGTIDNEETYFIDKLRKQGVQHLPRVITAQCLAEERDITYLEGGVLFISGRILVVDLLKNRVPLNLVSGILVYRAHSILSSYQEAFALRLYRRTNKTGFIKAFTSSALAFTIGFAQVEQVMKKLFVKRLYLWPRFHKIVNESLSKCKPEVLELHAKLTPKMVNIQTGLLDVMNYMIQELKRLNKYIDLEELTVENAVAKKFHKQIQLQLDPIWDQLSFKSKQLLSDLKTQRSLLMCLTHQDSVSFYSMINSLQTMEYAMKSSGWTALDIVDDMFKNAKLRVYNEKGDLQPEPNPKWTALTEVIMEIRHDMAKKKKDDAEKILILTQDSRTCSQLKNLLTMGGKEYLLYEAMKHLKPKTIQTGKKPESSSKTLPSPHISQSETEAQEITEEEQESYVLTLTQHIASGNNEDTEDLAGSTSLSQCLEDFSGLADLDLTTITSKEPLIIIQAIKKGGDSLSLNKTLDEALPSYVILYAADISAVRQLEVYQNKHPSIALKVYFLVYGGSVEEQAYLTSLRREKEAFDKLVMAKTTMVIPVEQDGKSEEPTLDIVEDDNTRKGGLKKDQATIPNKVIVDMREFRSELPSLLHQRDMEIEPVTLLIGDYILSPDICVERKSMADLIGSLNSGRLYNQAVAMSRYYAKPMLLIEFDPNKPFGLQGKYYVSRDTKSIEVTNKLQLLTIHFPRLKLVWSPSPHATAQLFEELKKGRSQPDGAKAALVGLDDDCDDKNIMAEKYNSHIQDFVAKLPGVHSKNLRVILNKGCSLDHMCSLSLEEITEMIGNKSDAELLYRSFHDKHKPDHEPSTSGSIKGGPSKVKSRGLFFKTRGK
ncbi:DNA repair endonuclease XPF [Phymastichus coffea]|uniref:DNA repair endonuclease XPF n=1 Tax=Phymastichus coffea TaxID=108790 RepID=UPI00273C877B|nr:DNA repair endonuclease XPF [Phymastichus coffea]